ncbi:MAG: hypothetical protein HY558_01040 [Euryarchaeota archaeon]|nr:hypothetical protein [Euryarchaeota archaeon]
MDSLDYDLVAHLVLHGPSSPRVLAHSLKASHGYVRRRLLFLVRRGSVRRAGWGLYECPEPPEENPALRERYWKLRAAFENRGVSADRKLQAMFEMSDFGQRMLRAARARARRG